MKNKLPLPPLRVQRGGGSAAMDISGRYYQRELKLK
jgi:hypothetical protein